VLGKTSSTFVSEINVPKQESCLEIWKYQKNFLSLQRQNLSFDYAAECGEQALIDTTPFKSRLRVAFIFHIFCGRIQK